MIHSRIQPIDEEVWADFAAGMRYVGGDFADPATFQRLRAAFLAYVADYVAAARK